MGKKLNWDKLQEGHGSRPLPGARSGPKYTSGRDFLQKGLAMEEEQSRMREHLAKAQPAMEALLKCRMEDGTPIRVTKPFQYVATDIVHQYDQTWDDSKSEWTNGEVRSSAFQEVQKSIRVGTELVLKGLDHNLQEFIFLNQKGEEVVIPYGAKQQLLMQTNIYDDTVEFINKSAE